jgi:hypothetical protein
LLGELCPFIQNTIANIFTAIAFGKTILALQSQITLSFGGPY